MTHAKYQTEKKVTPQLSNSGLLSAKIYKKIFANNNNFNKARFLLVTVVTLLTASTLTKMQLLGQVFERCYRNNFDTKIFSSNKNNLYSFKGSSTKGFHCNNFKVFTLASHIAYWTLEVCLFYWVWTRNQKGCLLKKRKLLSLTPII